MEWHQIVHIEFLYTLRVCIEYMEQHGYSYRVDHTIRFEPIHDFAGVCGWRTMRTGQFAGEVNGIPRIVLWYTPYAIQCIIFVYDQ